MSKIDPQAQRLIPDQRDTLLVIPQLFSFSHTRFGGKGVLIVYVLPTLCLLRLFEALYRPLH